MAGTLSLAGVAQAQTIDALRSSKEAVALREAFEPYRLCVADSAGRLLPNNRETASAIAEAAEPNCAAQAMASLEAMSRAFGPPTSSAHADERYRMLRTRVVKDVAAGIMHVRQEQASNGKRPLGVRVEPATYRVICTVTRPDGTPWGSPVWFVVDRSGGRINGTPAVFGEKAVTWNSGGTGLLYPKLSFGSDPEMSMVSASVAGTLQSVYQGPCKLDGTYRVSSP